ncbi:MAG TPA: helix-turn-helix domain-containing protein [Ktedonobacteraceae bacterium]|nr:helix-turn-helix domain-containing protein [Ktedonobacteraceae bacterium]
MSATNESITGTLDDFISEKEAAQFLGVNPRTVGRWADQGRLTRYKQFGLRVLYKRAEIEQFAKPVPDVQPIPDETHSKEPPKRAWL